MSLISPISLIRPIRHIRPKILFEVLGAILIASVIIGLFAYFSPKAAEAAWKDDNWHFRRKLVIDAAQVSDTGSADYTNFPVLVSIDNDSSLKSNAQSDGDDILFTSSDGTTQLDHEIESYTSDTGTLRAWVEIPTLDYDNDTTIYIYYGNSSAASQQNATGTWNSNFAGVWHLKDTPTGSAGDIADSTSNDKDGTSNGSMTSSDQVTGKVNGSLDFDGSNDYVVRALDGTALTQVTMSIWFKPTSNLSGNAEMFAWGPSLQSGGNFFAVNHIGTTLQFYADGGNRATTTISPNTWYHAVVTMNSSNLWSFYLNNTLIGTYQDDATHTWQSSANNTYIGVEYWGYFQGIIDEVKISNSARTAGWIATEYNNQNSPGTFFKSVGGEEKSKDPVLYFKLDDGQGTTAQDSSPNNLDGTLNNTPTWQTEDMCIFGKCLWFSGTANMNVSKTDDALLNFGTGSFSVSTWVKRNGISSANNVILTKSTANLGTTYTGYKLYMDSSGDLCFDTQDGTNAVDTACTLGVDFDDNQWHYVTGVKSGTTSLTLYVDGKSRATDSSIASTATLSNSSIFYVGVDSDGLATEWLGFIDEVKVYDFALSSSQAQANFASRGSVKGVSAQMGGGDMEWLSEGLVGYWKLDESSWNGTASEVIDSSGNGNHGTSSCTGGGCTVPSTTIGKFSNGGNFDGTENDYIDVGSPSVFDNMTEKTVSMWIKRTNITSSRALLGKNATSGTGNWEIQMRGNGLSAGPNTVRYNHGYSTLSGIWYSSTLLTDTSAWYHIAVSYDDSSSSNTPKIYVNGKQETVTRSQAPSGTESDDSANPVKIGSDAWAEYFQGNIDEVRIYNRILSPKEVRDLYNFAPGPVGYWKMDEGSGSTLNDLSGNGNNASLTGTTSWKSGKFGKDIDYNNGGTDGIANAGSGSSLDALPAITVSTWIRYRSQGGCSEYGRIVDKANNGNPGNGWFLAFAGGSSHGFTFKVGYSTTEINTVSSFGLSPGVNICGGSNKWCHVTTTWDGTPTGTNAVKFYVNGVLRSSSTPAASGTRNNDSALNLAIGNSENLSCYFDGELDDLRIYNYARTSKQIVEDMNAGHPAVGSPVGSAVGYWKFDEGQGTNANDSTPNNNDLTLSSASWTNSGKFGKAFNGATNIRLSRADDADLDFAASDDLSISLWFKSDSATNPSANEYLVEKGATVGSAAIGYAIYTSSSSDGLICFGIDDDAVTNFPEDSVCSSSDIYDNTWHHIVATKTSSRLDLYVDGKANGTPDTAISATGTLENSATFYLADANATDGTDEFLGDLDEVKIYRYALTEDEVKTEYNRGSSLVLGALGSNSSYQSNAANQEYCVPGDSTSCAAPIGEWKFEEKSGTTANNTGSNTDNGTLSSTRWTNGKFGGAVSFPASANGENITVSNAQNYINSTSSSFTISTFIKVLNGNAPFYWYGGPAIKRGALTGNGTCSTDAGITMEYRSATSARIYFNLPHQNSASCNASTTAGYTEATNRIFNRWYHASATYDSSSKLMSFYLDGVLIGTGTWGGSGDWTWSNSNLIFNNSNGGATTPGLAFDEIKIYNYARTPAQIAWDYNKGKPVAYWDFDECTGSTLNDFSGNSRTGTITIGGSGSQTATGTCTSSGAWFNGVTGKRNYSLKLDGNDDYITTAAFSPLSTAAQTTTSFSWGGWFYPTTAVASRYLMEKATNSTTAGEFHLYADANSMPICGIFYSSAFHDSSAPTTALSLNAWNHVLCTYDGTNINTYLNGKLVKQSAETTAVTAASSILYIGEPSTSPSSSNRFEGQMDEVKVWNYALSGTQVKNEVNQGAVNFGPSTGSP